MVTHFVGSQHSVFSDRYGDIAMAVYSLGIDYIGQWLEAILKNQVITDQLSILPAAIVILLHYSSLHITEG